MSRNDVTGDTIATRQTSDEYRDGFDRIWGQKEQEEVQPETEADQQNTPC